MQSNENDGKGNDPNECEGTKKESNTRPFTVNGKVQLTFFLSEFFGQQVSSAQRGHGLREPVPGTKDAGGERHKP